MYSNDNCDKKVNKLEYARAYILLQKYENLYSLSEGFYKGTIFKDLYRPYIKPDKCNKSDYKEEKSWNHMNY